MSKSTNTVAYFDWKKLIYSYACGKWRTQCILPMEKSVTITGAYANEIIPSIHRSFVYKTKEGGNVRILYRSLFAGFVFSLSVFSWFFFGIVLLCFFLYLFVFCFVFFYIALFCLVLLCFASCIFCDLIKKAFGIFKLCLITT
jgi:hypothetical protein